MTSQTHPPAGRTEVRRWQRFRFDVPVRVVLLRNGRELAFPGRGTGMNEGGIGLDVDAPIEIGDRVQVEFTPPYAALALHVRGTVRHAAGNRYGVEFLAADGAEEQEVKLFRRILRAAADRLSK